MQIKDTHSINKKQLAKISKFISKITIVRRHLNFMNKFDEEQKLQTFYASKALEFYNVLYSDSSKLLEKEEMITLNKWWRYIKRKYSNIL